MVGRPGRSRTCATPDPSGAFAPQVGASSATPKRRAHRGQSAGFAVAVFFGFAALAFFAGAFAVRGAAPFTDIVFGLAVFAVFVFADVFFFAAIATSSWKASTMPTNAAHVHAICTELAR